jgi:TDG/mug DNA glycosylase family protein
LNNKQVTPHLGLPTHLLRKYKANRPLPQGERKYLVPDLLAPGLRLVFCGTAPSAVSAREKAYYAKPGNQFWPTLHRIGLTPTLFSPQDYSKLLPLGIGLTDLCKTHSGNDDELPAHALDRDALTQKILRYKPKLVAFTSKNGASIYFGKKVEYGLQKETLGKTQFFVLCSTSGRARRFWREDVWRELAKIFEDKKCCSNVAIT